MSVSNSPTWFGKRFMVPKTDWKNGDIFNLSSYGVLANNLLYLSNLCAEAYPSLNQVDSVLDPIYPLPRNFFPTEKFFNDMVRGLYRIFVAAGADTSEVNKIKICKENGTPWDVSDLNILGEQQIYIKDFILTQQKAMYRLPLTLGGIQFGY